MRWLALFLWLALGGAAQAQPAFNPVSTQTSVPISIATATTTQLVAARPGLSVYVTSVLVVAGGAGNFQLVAGTGTNCATGTVNLTGAIPLVSGGGFVQGVGAGAVIVGPQGAALCALTSAAVQMSGVLAYAQF